MTQPLSRRDFCRTTLAAGTAVWGASQAAALAQSPAEKTAGRPNILFIMTDQQRYDCLGANGNAIIQTPNLDRLAAQSANFSRAFVQSPVCTPSRACYFTGRYAHAHRNRVNYTRLDADETLLPKHLQTIGYQTALVGKLHLYYHYPPTADEAKAVGFDHTELHDGVSYTDPWSAYAQWRAANDPNAKYAYRKTVQSVPELRREMPEGTNPLRSVIADEYTDTTWTGARTCHWLRELAADDQPFFLFSSFWKPHSPFEVPEPFDAMYNDVDIPLPKPETLEQIEQLPAPLAKLILRGKNPPYAMDRERLEWCYRSYYASISHIDREVGRILRTLEETGQADNTIVVFCSDHGDQMLEHGLMGKNVFFESSVRIPLMIRAPGHIRPGMYDSLVETVDVLPTLFDLIGQEEPYNCQGQNLMPAIGHEGGAWDEPEAVFCENVMPEVITTGSLDFEFEKGRGVKGVRHPDAKMVRTDRWKYNHYPGLVGELYDLHNDPLESHNLASDPARASVVAEMQGRLLDWLSTASETDQIAPRWEIHG